MISTPTQSTATHSPLQRARQIALDALAAIIEDPDAPHREKRLAAAAILKYVAHAESTIPPEPDEADVKAAEQRTLRQLDDAAADAYDRGYADRAANLPPEPFNYARVLYTRLTRGMHEPPDDADEAPSPHTPSIHPGPPTSAAFVG